MFCGELCRHGYDVHHLLTQSFDPAIEVFHDLIKFNVRVPRPRLSSLLAHPHTGKRKLPPETQSKSNVGGTGVPILAIGTVYEGQWKNRETVQGSQRGASVLG